jgi:hypothetical protein
VRFEIGPKACFDSTKKRRKRKRERKEKIKRTNHHFTVPTHA